MLSNSYGNSGPSGCLHFVMQGSRMGGMYRLIQIIGSCVLLEHMIGYGQTGPTLIGPRESAGWFVIAPGQVITLEVFGLKTVLLSNPPIITNLSVTVNQDLGKGVSLSAPVLNVSQKVLGCSSDPLNPECLLTLVTVQMPFELAYSTDSHQPNIGTQIVISENGAPSKAFIAGVIGDNIHILKVCGNGNPSGSISCVTHADGTVISPYSPAKAGETVVVYAYGLGKTNPPVKTGAITPDSAPTVVPTYNSLPVSFQFDFTPNARPYQEAPYSTWRGSVRDGLPEFAGLTPGFVGLYQINIKLPEKFPPVPACGGSVTSNLMINIAIASSDGAPICVQPTQ